MKRLAVLAALVLCLPFTARADDASLHAKAQELVTLLHSERMLGQISVSMKKRVIDAAQKAIDSNPVPENKAKLDDFDKKAGGLIDAQVGWTTMEPFVTNIYAKTFTEDELTSIIAFYKSPAGAAFLEKTPDVNVQVTQLAQGRIADLQKQLNVAYEEFRKSLTPATATPPAAAPPSATPPAASTPK